jgi:hypothetical protein
MRRLPVVIFVLACAGFARAEDDGKALAAELAQLKSDFEKKSEEWFKPFREAKTDEERNNIQLDWEKDPRKAFSPRFLDLAKRARGTEAGFEATSWLLGGGTLSDEDRLAVLQDVGSVYVSSPGVEKIFPAFVGNCRSLGHDAIASVLSALVAGSPHRGVKAGARFTLGELEGYFKNEKGAREILETVEKDFADTEWGKRARGKIFQMEHLAMGKVAPDFEAEDEKGQKFNFSDYRGKVVVIDFWGFW